MGRGRSVGNAARRVALAGSAKLVVEQLEQRMLLNGTTKVNVPQWIAQGPAPIKDQAFVAGIPGGPATGSVEAIATPPVYDTIAYIASVSGGVWRTSDLLTSDVHWEPLSDQLRSSSTSAVAISPFDNKGRRVDSLSA